MTEFEILSIPIFFVLGLGITKILGGVGSAIRRRDQGGFSLATVDAQGMAAAILRDLRSRSMSMALVRVHGSCTLRKQGLGKS